MAGERTSSSRAIFEKASRLRDELLLSRIPFDTLLFVKRKPYFSEQPFMDAHHLFNRPGGGVYRLSPVSPDGRVTPVVDSLGEGIYRDLALGWDARTFLFAFGNGSDRWTGEPSYHIFEARIDGSGLRQLTSGPKNDCEPFYLPNGQIGFTSDRSEHFVMCGGDRHSPTLFAMEHDGSQVRQLSFNVFNDFNPCVMPDGRILYSRWEYNERSVTSLHHPFTMNPDGTMVSPYYGNATIRPNVVMFPRPVPGSTKIMALFTAHHGQTHGAVGLINVRKGIDGNGPLEVLTPNVPIPGEHPEDSRHGWFSDPVPLSEFDLALLLHAHRRALARSDVGTLRGRSAWKPGLDSSRSGDLLRGARAGSHTPGAARTGPSAARRRRDGCRSDALSCGRVDRAQQSAPRRAEIPARARRRAAQERSGRRRDHDVGHADFHHQACDRHGADRGRRLGPFRRAGQPQHVLRSPRQGAPGNPADAKRGLFEAG